MGLPCGRVPGGSKTSWRELRLTLSLNDALEPDRAAAAEATGATFVAIIVLN